MQQVSVDGSIRTKLPKRRITHGYVISVFTLGLHTLELFLGVGDRIGSASLGSVHPRRRLVRVLIL